MGDSWEDWKIDAERFLQDLDSEIMRTYGKYIYEREFFVSPIGGSLRYACFLSFGGVVEWSVVFDMVWEMSKRGFLLQRRVVSWDGGKRIVMLSFVFSIPFEHPYLLPDCSEYLLQYYNRKRSSISIISEGGGENEV